MGRTSRVSLRTEYAQQWGTCQAFTYEGFSRLLFLLDRLIEAAFPPEEAVEAGYGKNCAQ